MTHPADRLAFDRATVTQLEPAQTLPEAPNSWKSSAISGSSSSRDARTAGSRSRSSSLWSSAAVRPLRVTGPTVRGQESARLA